MCLIPMEYYFDFEKNIDFHRNIFIDNKGSPCGSRISCQHCEECIKQIDIFDLKNKIIEI